MGCGASVEARIKQAQQDAHIAADLFKKIHADDAAQVKQLLAKQRTAIRLLDPFSQGTVLHVASVAGSFAVARLLIERKAAVDAADTSRRTALHVVVQSLGKPGHLDVAKALIGARAKPQAADVHRKTPLHYAARRGALELVRLLLNSKAELKSKDSGGETAVHEAARGPDASPALEVLVSAGADPRATDSKRRTPLHFAAFHGNEAALLVLFREFAKLGPGAGSDVDEKGETALHYACRNGQADSIARLLRLIQVDTPNKDGQSGLHLASAAGHATVVEQLLVGGGRVQLQDSKGDTPVHLAARAGRIKVLQAFSLRRMLFSAHNTAGRTPVFEAASAGHCAAVECLVEGGISLVDPDNSGATPLHAAVQLVDGHEVIFTLITSRASLEARDSTQKSPLWLAVEKRHLATVRYLLVAKANASVTDAAGNTLMHEAARQGDVAMAKLLVGYSDKKIPVALPVSVRNNAGETPSQVARAKGHEVLMQILENMQGPSPPPSLATPPLPGSTDAYTAAAKQLLQPADFAAKQLLQVPDVLPPAVPLREDPVRQVMANKPRPAPLDSSLASIPEEPSPLTTPSASMAKDRCDRRLKHIFADAVSPAMKSPLSNRRDQESLLSLLSPQELMQLGKMSFGTAGLPASTGPQLGVSPQSSPIALKQSLAPPLSSQAMPQIAAAPPPMPQPVAAQTSSTALQQPDSGLSNLAGLQRTLLPQSAEGPLKATPLQPIGSQLHGQPAYQGGLQQTLLPSQSAQLQQTMLPQQAASLTLPSAALLPKPNQAITQDRAALADNGTKSSHLNEDALAAAAATGPAGFEQFVMRLIRESGYQVSSSRDLASFADDFYRQASQVRFEGRVDRVAAREVLTNLQRGIAEEVGKPNGCCSRASGVVGASGFGRENQPPSVVTQPNYGAVPPPLGTQPHCSSSFSGSCSGAPARGRAAAW